MIVLPFQLPNPSHLAVFQADRREVSHIPFLLQVRGEDVIKIQYHKNPFKRSEILICHWFDLSLRVPQHSLRKRAF